MKRQGKFQVAQSPWDNVNVYNRLMPLIDQEESVQALALGALLYDLLEPKSVLDVGCGTGLYLVPFRGKARIFGIDGASESGRHLLKDEFTLVDLRLPWDPAILPQTNWDLDICIEVAEHLRPEYANQLVGILTHTGRNVFFSAAHPNQGGWGHFNEQPLDYWVTKFDAQGYERHPQSEALVQSIKTLPAFEHPGWLRDNCVLLRRKGS